MKLANKYGLHDHPNGRSSHHQPTVTGMGIILVLSIIIYLFWHFRTSTSDQLLPNGFVVGFLLITMVSFVDDIFFLKHSLRLIVQFIATGLLVFSLDFESKGIEEVLLGFAAMLFAIGVLNAYNFMDGANGMLTLHCLLVLSSLWYLNETITDKIGNKITFTSTNFILSIIIPMGIFGFFNIRKKAMAFIGDVGSVGIAFVIVYLMYNLVLSTGNFTYLLLFSVFGADAGLTVVYKLILRENIFVPHRDFIFKKLVHIAKWSHLRVSFYFFLAQASINILVLSLPQDLKPSLQLSVLFIVVLGLIAAYIFLQNALSRKRSHT